MNTQEAISTLEMMSKNYKHMLTYASYELLALTHAIEHMKRGQWMPIETAPKDGTHIIVSRPCYPGMILPECGYDYWGKDYWGRGAWMKSNQHCQPTHYMPLPEPPQILSTASEGENHGN
jgi:hypothetical protein